MLKETCFIVIVGVPGIEPGLHAPHARVLPIYYTPTMKMKAKNFHKKQDYLLSPHARVLPIYYSPKISTKQA